MNEYFNSLLALRVEGTQEWLNGTHVVHWYTKNSKCMIENTNNW